MGDLRLLEDGGERGGALVSDLVALKTVSERHGMGNGENVGVSTGADMKASIGDRLLGKLLRLAQRLLESLSNTPDDFFLFKPQFLSPLSRPTPLTHEPHEPPTLPSPRFLRPLHDRGQRRAPALARRMQRPLVVQLQSPESLADLALPTPCSRPQIDQHRVRALRRAVEGAHKAQHASFGHTRAQPARLVKYSANSHHAPQTRPTAPRVEVRPHLPGKARARGAHERAPVLRGAAPREAREVAAVEAVLVRVRDEGTRRSEWTRGGG